jgi:hypothetical protein
VALASAIACSSVAKRKTGRDRPEGLLDRDPHVRGRAGEDRRLVERPAERVLAPADHDLGAVRDRVGHVLADLGQRAVVDQRALLDASSKPSPTRSACVSPAKRSTKAS